MRKFNFIAVAIAVVLVGCSKSDVTTNEGDRDDATINLEGNLEVSDFVWNGLNQYYYWQDQVANLADSKAANPTAYAQFIQENSDPEAFFESLNHPDDRFSWIVDNYVDLENTLAGIEASNGMEFLLTRQCSSCAAIVGVVIYIEPNSDAEAKGVERGDIFSHVDGTLLTDSNYRDLLFSDDLNYTIELAAVQNDGFVRTGESFALVKEENFQTNPILVNKILDVGGAKVGYLMYNRFLNEFDEALNDVFGNFQSAGVNELVLDLRYNPGGSVQTCIYLASMITGSNDGTVFSKEQWNPKLMAYWEENNPSRLTDRFTGFIAGGTEINSLNLSRVYVLTSSRSASASELLINGLTPHIEVIHIGDQTRGKNVGSITVYDYIDNEGTKNPDHTYAMQPIVLKIANSENFSDYTDGLEPDITLKESFSNLGVLGDPNEPLLQRALSEISGTATAKSGVVHHPITHTLPLPQDAFLEQMHVQLQKATATKSEKK